MFIKTFRQITGSLTIWEYMYMFSLKNTETKRGITISLVDTQTKYLINFLLNVQLTMML